MSERALLDHIHVPCALCGADDTRVLFGGAGRKGLAVYRGEQRLAVTGTERLVRCRRCGLVYVDPQRQLGPGLATYPASEEAAYFAQTRAARLAGAEQLLVRIEALLPGRGRLLDIGCGDGALLAVAQRRGWDVAGLEPSARLVEQLAAGELAGRVVQGRVEELGPAHSQADVVILLNVLEHLSTPREALLRIAGLLRPGGLLAVHVPNWAWGRWFGRRWVQFEPLDHLNYFTSRTLRAMLLSVGLQPILRFSLPGLSPWKVRVQWALNGIGLWPGSGLGLLARSVPDRQVRR
ncbi:MAG: class I SAM-dependent methyltransferase [Anaerolineales bacterium]